MWLENILGYFRIQKYTMSHNSRLNFIPKKKANSDVFVIKKQNRRVMWLCHVWQVDGNHFTSLRLPY